MSNAGSHTLSVPHPPSCGVGMHSSSPLAGGTGCEGLNWADCKGADKLPGQTARNAVTPAPRWLSTMDSVFVRPIGLTLLPRAQLPKRESDSEPLVLYYSLGGHQPPSGVMILVLFHREGTKIHPLCSRHTFWVSRCLSTIMLFCTALSLAKEHASQQSKCDSGLTPRE